MKSIKSSIYKYQFEVNVNNAHHPPMVFISCKNNFSRIIYCFNKKYQRVLNDPYIYYDQVTKEIVLNAQGIFSKEWYKFKSNILS